MEINIFIDMLMCIVRSLPTSISSWPSGYDARLECGVSVDRVPGGAGFLFPFYTFYYISLLCLKSILFFWIKSAVTLGKNR